MTTGLSRLTTVYYGYDPLFHSFRPFEQSSTPKSGCGEVLGIGTPRPDSICHAHLGHPAIGGHDRSIGKQISRIAEGWGTALGGNIGNRKGEMAQVKTWKTFFTAPTRTKSMLDFFALARVEGMLMIHPPAEAVFEGMSLWKGCLVGQFFDKRLPIHVVRAVVNRLCGKHEMPEISTMDNGLYLFRFRDMDAMD